MEFHFTHDFMDLKLSIFFYMRAKVTCLFAVLLLLAGIHCQSWTDSPASATGFDSYEGSILPHMYSTVVWL